MKFMRNLVLGITLVIGAMFMPTAKSADLTLSGLGTANTVSNVLNAGGFLIKAIAWVNTSTNAAIIKLYDISNTTTTIVQEAYTSFGTPYATNIVTTFTNAAGIVMTNTVPGTFTPSSTVALATNERPRVLEFLVGPSGVLNLTDVNRMVGNGLSILPNNSGTYLITYQRAL